MTRFNSDEIICIFKDFKLRLKSYTHKIIQHLFFKNFLAKNGSNLIHLASLNCKSYRTKLGKGDKPRSIVLTNGAKTTVICSKICSGFIQFHIWPLFLIILLHLSATIFFSGRPNFRIGEIIVRNRWPRFIWQEVSPLFPIILPPLFANFFAQLEFFADFF